MSKTALKGIPISLNGDAPIIGSKFPNLRLIKTDLSVLETKDLTGKKIVFNYIPSIDMSVCELQLSQFTNRLKDNLDVINLFASKDLPFALSRYCEAEGIENVITTSDFRFNDLEKIGVMMTNGPLAGLAARGTIVVDEDQNVVYAELTNDIVDEPDYDEALRFI